MKYVLLNSDNIIVDKIMYDPSSDWTPPTGLTVGAIPDDISVDNGGKWESGSYTAPTIVEMPDDIKKGINEEEAKRRLAESDWTNLSDVQGNLTDANQTEWNTYRQTLRTFLGEGSTSSLPRKPNVVWKT